MKTIRSVVSTLCLCEIINSFYFFPISSFLLTLYLSPFFLCQFSSFLLSSFIHWQFIFSATTTNVSQYPEWKSEGASTTPNCVSRGHVYFSLGTNGQTKLRYDSFMFMFIRFTMFAKLQKMSHYRVYQKWVEFLWQMQEAKYFWLVHQVHAHWFA